MAMVDLKGVHRVTAKGRTYVYAWRGGPRIAAAEGTAAFVEELADAQAARLGGDPTKLSGLCARFRASDEWQGFAAKTRKNWSPWLDRIQAKFGTLSLKQFDRVQMRPEIRRWRDGFKATPRAADVALQVFSRLLAFGEAEGRLTRNIVTAIPHLYRSDRSGIIWTDDDLAALAKVASREVLWAAQLGALTGLRQGSLLRLAWSHVGKQSIELRTARKGRAAEAPTVVIPIYGALRELLDAIPKRATTVLTNSRGLPWKTGFGASWGDAVKASKVDKHFHDLRGTAATRLYGADFTLREIAGVLGWSEDAVEAIITRYVKRDELLRDKIRRLDEAEARTKAVKPPVKPASPNQG